MAYAEPNATTLYDLAEYANSITNNWLGNIVVVMVFVISFITLKAWPTTRALAASLFITSILAVLLRILGLIGDWMMTIVLICFGISVIALYLSEQ